MAAGYDSLGDGVKAKLEIFDGTDTSTYRQWKRRAQMMLASLPSTVNEKKFGPKLMGLIAGEAEALLESLPVEKICNENGHNLIWEMLDEKYLPQTIDLLQEAMKLFFQELQIKNGETYKQFLVRFEHAQRKLAAVEVKLPEVVSGFTLLKKLRLDQQSEAMILTATQGKLELKEVIKAIKSVFPEGKGGNVKRTKEVFQVEDDEVQSMEDEFQAALDVMVAEVQARDGEDEEVLEVFESYTEIRKKIADQKKGRGYFPPVTRDKEGGGQSWKLTGSINGRIDQLKSRSRCFTCHRFGHWKRECPVRKNKEKNKERSAASGSGGKEAYIVEDNDPTAQSLWDVFSTDVKDVAENVTWGESTANDVRNAGSADTHSTGNRQRPWQNLVSPKEQQEGLEPEPFWEQFEVFHEGDVLSAEEIRKDKHLTLCGVPDTACRKTLVGAETLKRIESHLKGFGLKTSRARVHSEFRFGNAGTLTSEEAVLLPANIAGKRVVVRAAILPDEGSETPLLLSKEFLRQLGSVVDLDYDTIFFRRLGVEVDLKETLRGHYAIIPLFDYGGQLSSVDCCAVETCRAHKHTARTKSG